MSDETVLEMPGLDGLEEEKLLDSANYDLEIRTATKNELTVTNRDSGEEEEREVINVGMVAPGEPDRAMIFHTLWLPDESYDTPDQVVRKERDLKRFLVVFGISFKKGKIDLADFIGKTANLGVKQIIDKKGEPRVNVNIPRFLPGA